MIHVCGTLLNVAWEDASINGQQVQALASLDGLCEWVSCCLDTNDGGGSNVIAGLMMMSGGVGGGGGDGGVFFFSEWIPPQVVLPDWCC